MKIYAVKLNAWASPALVQARTQKKAKEMALKEYPKCDCCGQDTYIENVSIYKGSTLYRRVMLEVVK